jgi:hypothetical protein
MESFLYRFPFSSRHVTITDATRKPIFDVLPPAIGLGATFTTKSTSKGDVFTKQQKQKQSLGHCQGSSTSSEMPYWPDRFRGLPNVAIRCALFTISKIRKTSHTRQLLATLKDLEVRFTGERWNQQDLDLFEHLVHISRSTKFGTEVNFLAKDVLLALGHKLSGKEYSNLKEDITRLMSGVVEITWLKTGRTYIGHLIEKVSRDERTQRYSLILDEKILSLYETGHTWVDFAKHQRLSGNNLAKFMHRFYSTHAIPVDYHVKIYMDLCGSDLARLTDFRKALRVALARLKAEGCLSDWEIDGEDLVKVRKKPSDSQSRHLTRRQEHANSIAFSSQS